MDKIFNRFFDWIESKGGVQRVAEKVGKAPQTFYNYQRRNSLPNMETLSLIAEQYPDFDANYVLTGQSLKTDVTEKDQEILMLQMKIDVLKSLLIDSTAENRGGKKFNGIGFRPGSIKGQTNPVRNVPKRASRTVTVDLTQKESVNTSQVNKFGIIRFCDN